MAKRERDATDVPETKVAQTVITSKTEEPAAKRLRTNHVEDSNTNVAQDEGNDAAISTPATPTLLGIPGELRNRIYQYVLVEGEGRDNDDGGIYIDDNNYQLPGILRASKQLRDEGIDIYLNENYFTLRIRNLKFAPQRQHWIWNKIYHEYLFQQHFGNRSWTNFKEWLKEYWKGGPSNFPRMPIIEDASEDERIFDRAFDIVDSLWDLRWERVEEVLETFRGAINGKMEQWAFDRY